MFDPTAPTPDDAADPEYILQVITELLVRTQTVISACVMPGSHLTI